MFNILFLIFLDGMIKFNLFTLFFFWMKPWHACSNRLIPLFFYNIFHIRLVCNCWWSAMVIIHLNFIYVRSRTTKFNAANFRPKLLVGHSFFFFEKRVAQQTSNHTSYFNENLEFYWPAKVSVLQNFRLFTRLNRAFGKWAPHRNSERIHIICTNRHHFDHFNGTSRSFGRKITANRGDI